MFVNFPLPVSGSSVLRQLRATLACMAFSRGARYPDTRKRTGWHQNCELVHVETATLSCLAGSLPRHMNNIVTFGDKEWIAKMADKDWPSPILSVLAFGLGLLLLWGLNSVARRRVDSLHRKGDTQELRDKVKHLALSPTIAAYEQFLFYLAAVAGLQVFGFAVGGWLVFKGISKYPIWTAPEKQPEQRFLKNQSREFLEDAALKHNFLQIFLIGTLMSVAAGGIAGAAYHYALYLLESHPGIILDPQHTMSLQITPDMLTAFGSAGAGALLGSVTAFGFGIYHQHLERRERQQSALLRAQYALMSQWNILEDMRRGFLEPNREDPNRFLMRPYHSFGRAVSVPFDDIAFIVRSNEPDLLQQIHIAEQGFETVTEVLRIRNQKMEEFYKLGASKFDFQTGVATVEAPPEVAFILKSITDALYEASDKAMPKLWGEIQALTDFIRRKYKKAKPLKMVVRE